MSRPLVLVAEDDFNVRLTLEIVLQDEGFDTVMAADGEEALKAARSSSPDVILLDQIMPKLDGKQVLHALRQDAATRDIPVFVLSGMERGVPDDWPGAQFVGKPFSPEELVRRIRAALPADKFV
ncbi:MAG TPA: response regulator [Actinomycetota bacterium]|nr:response regulator [Actinomycetota bacterium]